TNLGRFGIDAFTPIVHLPQSAILGVGRIAPEPAVVADRIVARETLTLSLTFDHRVVDGAPPARFLEALRRRPAQRAPWRLPGGDGPPWIRSPPPPRRSPRTPPPRCPPACCARSRGGSSPSWGCCTSSTSWTGRTPASPA